MRVPWRDSRLSGISHALSESGGAYGRIDVTVKVGQPSHHPECAWRGVVRSFRLEALLPFCPWTTSRLAQRTHYSHPAYSQVAGSAAETDWVPGSTDRTGRDPEICAVLSRRLPKLTHLTDSSPPDFASR